MPKELLLLKTSASSSIRGYNYQFLKTLEVWVNNYINYGDEVFCENEDDFVEKHLDSKIYRFNQIKCYTNEFSLDSEAIKKSLCNFFKIYRSFDKEGYKLEFRLQSNSKPKDGNILSDWFKNQDSLSEELLNSIENRLELILEINHDQVDKLNLRAFIECVKWSFENLDPETSINELIDNIKGLLLKIPDSDIIKSQTDLIFSKLYFEVVQKCSLPDGKLRRLTHENLIDSISHEEDAWYVKTKEDWKEYQTEKYTFGDFIAIRIAAVHSMYTKYLHNDIEFWIRILENVVLREDKNSAIKRQAIYEIVVFSLRVLKLLENRREYILFYFEEMNNFKSYEHLSEALMLLNYLNVAKSYENFEIPVEQNEIDNWISHLDEIINYEIDLGPESSRICDLYFLKGNFLFFFSNKSNSIDSLKGSIEKSINWYQKIVPELPLVPLFSVDRLLFLLNKQLKSFLNFRDLELNRLEKLICEIEDYYIQNREKEFEGLKDRAISYFESQRYYSALNIFHRLNLETEFYERLYFNTLIKLLIGDCYRIMGLSYASLRYSLLGMSQVIENIESKNELLRLLPKALMSCINSCKIQGNWILQMFYIRAYFIFQSKFVGYFNANQAKDENEIFNQMVNIFFINEKFSCISKTKLKSIFPLDLDFYNQVVQGLKESRKIFNKVSKNQLLKQLEDQMIDYPFNDFNKKRTTVWNAFGIEWSICFRMDYDIFFKVERFASFFQIFLAELTDVDLCLPFNIKVILNFSQNENSEITINRAHKNNIQVWDIYITDKFNNQEELQFLQISSTVILELSLLKGEKILSTIKDELFDKSKLAEKLNLNKDISFLREILIPKKYFDITFENSKINKPFDFNSNLETILQPLTSLGITYNRDNNLIQISNRYKRIIQCNKYTLLDLIKEPSVQIAIKRFKSEGYLDWHILACIFNSKINYLVNELRKKGLPIEYCLQEGKRLAEMPEEIHSKIVIPKTEFTYEKLKKELKTYVLATLQSYDLEFKNESPPFEAIEAFLTQRYNFKKDDVPHPNYWRGEGLA